MTNEVNIIRKLKPTQSLCGLQGPMSSISVRKSILKAPDMSTYSLLDKLTTLQFTQLVQPGFWNLLASILT